MAANYSGQLVFEMSQGAGEQATKRRRQDYAYDKWKYRVQNENDPATTAKRQRSNNVKKVKERERRTKMAESVQSLRDIIPGCTSRKSNQIVVMNSAVEYIKRLEDAVKRLQHESELFRQSFAQHGLALPLGVSSERIVVDFEALSAMDESDSDDDRDDRDRRGHDDEDSSAMNGVSSSIPVPVLQTAPLPTMSGQQSSSAIGVPAPSVAAQREAELSQSIPSTPIPIPGTVGAPIRPHETRTRLERVTGSSQHLVNKNPRKLSPVRERFLSKGIAESLAVDVDVDQMNQKVMISDQNSPADMMEAEMDFMNVNDIEEVGEWPLYNNSRPASAPQSANSANFLLGHGKLVQANDSPNLNLMTKFDSPAGSTGKGSVGTFSPKLVFVDSPTNLLAGASYTTYVNPFDSGF